MSFKRSWQDWVFTIGGALLSLSLVPALWGHVNAPTWAAAFAVGTLLAFTYTYLSLRFYFATGMALIQVLLWSVVLVHSIH